MQLMVLYENRIALSTQSEAPHFPILQFSASTPTFTLLLASSLSFSFLFPRLDPTWKGTGILRHGLD